MDLRKMLSGAAGSAPAIPSTPADGYFTDGDPLVPTPASVPGARWFHEVSEEFRNVLIAAGITPSQATLTQLLAAIQALLPTGYISGLQVANNATDADHDIDIAVGIARAANASHALALGATLTKQIDAPWAEGSGAGGMFTGAVAADTWYHLHLIEKDADGAIDGGFDTDVAAANRPAGWSAYRRIFSVRTDGSGNILAFNHQGNDVWWDDMVSESSANPTTPTLLTVTVPPDIQPTAIMTAQVSAGSGESANLEICHPSRSNMNRVFRVGYSSGAGDISSRVTFRAPCNGASQIKHQWSEVGAPYSHNLSCLGYEDRREDT